MASGNRTATVLVAPLWSKITWSYSVRVGSLRSRQSWEEHRRVVEHIERRDGTLSAEPVRVLLGLCRGGLSLTGTASRWSREQTAYNWACLVVRRKRS